MIESIPRGQNREENRENLLSRVVGKAKVLLGETTESRNPEFELVAGYLGIALAQEVLHGRMTKEEIGQKFEEFENSGLPIDRVTKSYRFFTARGMIIKWFDVNFQLETLERYLPEVFERLNRNSE